MRFPRLFLLLALTLAAGACVVGPTGDDVDDELERRLRSVAGPWAGTSTALTLDFQLQEGAGNAVSGSGTMKEAAPGTVPITVTGTFQRPLLSLTISGITYQGRAVQGTFQGDYTTVGGISGPLHLTAPGYSSDVTILLQER